MKKIIFIILVLFTTMILLPAAFVLPTMPKEKEDTAKKNVSVLIKEKNAVETFPLEEYLVGVVAAEMPASFHEEALKAQAVAARTFIYNRMVSGEADSDHPDAYVCTDSTHCKAWLSLSETEEKMGKTWMADYFPKIKASVTNTEGEIITYEAEPIIAVFHSASSGKTENAEDVWGGAFPYLKSVESAEDDTNEKFLSQKEVPKEEICRTLGVTEAKVIGYEHNEGGTVKTVNIGGYLFRGIDIRAYFDLKSADFEIEETENSFIFHVKGSGHGVGLSQYGADAMAQKGSTYKEILSAYYTDVSIEKVW